MATNQGWFVEWFAGGWFPPVWFAPGDESHLTPQELRPGGKRRQRIGALPHWSPAPTLQVPPVAAAPKEDDDALLLCGLL